MGGVILQKVTFTNAMGESIELYQKPFFLNKIEGLGDVEAEIESQKAPGQDGTTFIDVTLEERFIPIEVVILEEFQKNRRLISRIFNPKLGPGTLVYENNTVRREILAIPEHVPKFYDERPRLAERVSIDLLCPNPYWTSEEIKEQLVVWSGGLKFPLKLPTKFSTWSSESKSKILLNDGDANTPVFIEFKGPATAPIEVHNVTTGEFISVNQNLLDGEKLEINTAFGQKRVNKVSYDGSRSNVFHYIDLKSTFFGLVPGNNLIRYSTGGEELYERAEVSISWRNRYLGL